MIHVFYDGKCGACRREIQHYMRIAPQNTFVWVDITVAPEIFTELGYKVSDGLMALHVRDAAHKMHIGIDAFTIIWQQLPRWKLLGSMINLPIIRPLANHAYRVFAAWRFKKMGYDTCAL
jgi:predicted DCC family thiol-disulfide oxidoreductase YuxK